MIPERNEPGTLFEQLAGVVLSLRNGEINGTTAAEQWEPTKQTVKKISELLFPPKNQRDAGETSHDPENPQSGGLA